MQKYTNTVPFFHTIYTGTSTERAGLVSPQMLDQFIETDTGATYTYAGSAWGKTAQNGVPITIAS